MNSVYNRNYLHSKQFFSQIIPNQSDREKVISDTKE